MHISMMKNVIISFTFFYQVFCYLWWRIFCGHIRVLDKFGNCNYRDEFFALDPNNLHATAEAIRKKGVEQLGRMGADVSKLREQVEMIANHAVVDNVLHDGVVDVDLMHHKQLVHNVLLHGATLCNFDVIHTIVEKIIHHGMISNHILGCGDAEVYGAGDNEPRLCLPGNR